MHTVLMTGATGFVGSALAANFLTRSMRVIALVRDDPEGVRTRRAINEAGQGFGLSGLSIASSMTTHLQIVHVDEVLLADNPGSRGHPALTEVTEVWHCAAEMSYTPRSLTTSFKTNVGITCALYLAVNAYALKCRRFYHVSSAYVSGAVNGQITETLRWNADCLNPYQVTKWSAEVALKALSDTGRVPVTLFRPSIIVGHEQTGWVKRNGFGVYMFADVMEAVTRANLQVVTLEAMREGRPDMIPINRLVDDAVALTVRLSDHLPSSEFEIFHCSGGLSLNYHTIVTLFGEAFGVSVSYGPSKTILEQQINLGIALRRELMEHELHFDRSKLDAAVGHTTSLEAIDTPTMCRLIAWYQIGIQSGRSSLRGS
ncbi:SDR family oxidoreductase [Glaciimonas sp. GG7]